MVAEHRYTPPQSRAASFGAALLINGALIAGLIFAAPEVAEKLKPHEFITRNIPLPTPPVEPVKLIDLTPEDARAYNATIPFSTDPNPAARPFHLTGSELDQQRAIACLAVAVLYEAGDDTEGEFRRLFSRIVNLAAERTPSAK